MRRTRTLITTGVTAVPSNENVGSALSSVGTSAWREAVAAEPQWLGDDEDTGAPPFKRFRLPGKVLARLGMATAQGRENERVAVAGDDDDVAAAVREKRQAAVRRSTVDGDNNAACRGRGTRPIISVSRAARQQFLGKHQPQECVQQSLAPEHFANSNDDVIRFGTAIGTAADSESLSLVSSSSWHTKESEKYNEDTAASQGTKWEKEIDRHFEGYGSDELASLSGSGLDERSDGEEEAEEDENGDHNSSENGNDSDNDYSNVDRVEHKPGEKRVGFGLLERRRQEQAQKNQKNYTVDDDTIPLTVCENSHQRFHYNSMFFQMHIGCGGVNPCHHTLLCVNGPITIQGPCGIIGFGIGEVAVGGFFLGKKQIALLSSTETAVLMPVLRIKNKTAGVESLPVPVLFKESNEKVVTILPRVIEGNNCVGAKGNHNGNNNDDADVDMFGIIDWDWVETTIKSWKDRFASEVPSTVLIVQLYDPCGPAPTRRQYVKNRGKLFNDSSFVDLPRFVARCQEPGIDVALLPEVIPAIVKQGHGAVVVLGSQGIGKSTLARFLTNVLFSQHGVCYWLDLDLGQPEFSPPGVVSVYCVQRPLFCPNDTTKVSLVKSFFLGGSRLRCPVTAAIAVEQLCNFVEPLQRRYPVVVNTHGWVLSTGRRITVEVIRRLRPKHIIHLVRGREARWARDGETLMNPAEGLNSAVLHNRFLLHRPTSGATEKVDCGVIGRLPHPYSKSNSATKTGWQGMVHTVHVERNEETLSQQAKLRPKGSALRRSIWQRHLYPLFHHYETLDKRKGGRRQQATSENTHLEEEEGSTTLLTGPLERFDTIVSADTVDYRDMTEEVVCAALEHSVVALSFFRVSSFSPSTVVGKHEKGRQEKTRRKVGDEGPLKNYRCLIDMPSGFSVSCFGFVESTEAEMRTSGEVKIRLPFCREVLRGMLTAGGETEKVCISLAFTAADRADLAALEAYF